MAGKSFSQNLRSFNKLGSAIAPIQCVSDLVQAYTNYLTVKEQEQTKRREIEAWERTTLADIEMKRAVLIGFLEKSFDERSHSFQALFKTMDQAIANDDNQKLSETLSAIVALAQTNPFQQLADLSYVQTALSDPDHVWEL